MNQGFESDSLIREFQKQKSQIHPVVEKMIEESRLAVENVDGNGDDLTKELFGDLKERCHMLPITYLNPAKKYLKKLKEKPLKQQFLNKIQALRLDPHIGELKGGDLAGIYCCDIQYRGTNYELAYRLEENQNGELIIVMMAGTRKKFYQELKRYIN